MHLIRLTRSSRPLFRRGYSRVIHGKTRRVSTFSRGVCSRVEENDEMERGEMKKKISFHDTIVVVPAVPVIQHRTTQRVCLSQQRHINIVIVYEQILSILSEKNNNDGITRDGMRAENITKWTGGFIRRVDFARRSCRPDIWFEIRLMINKNQKNNRLRTHVREI